VYACFTTAEKVDVLRVAVFVVSSFPFSG